MAHASKSRQGLGRGLSSLIGDLGLEGNAQRYTTGVPALPAERAIPIEKILPNPAQPRRDFDSTGLRELAKSIGEKGVIQPLIVRPDSEIEDSFLIVAGERRWRAAQVAKLHELPVIVRDMTEDEGFEIGIIENIQREDLNPYEEAQGYRQLMEKFGHTQERLSIALGKSRSHIANLLRLLNLPGEVLDLLRTGKLTAAHARAIVPCKNPTALAKRIIAEGLSVRQTEKLAQDNLAGEQSSARRRQKDADTRALEADLSANLRTKVSLKQSKVGSSGEIHLKYKSLDQLDDLCEALREAGQRLRPRA